MLTISSDPKLLMKQTHNYRTMLEWAMCERFDLMQKRDGRQHKCELDENKNLVSEYGKGLRFAFRTEKGDKWPVLLLYGPANYVYTFERNFKDMREATGRITSHDDWKLTGYHDSCWRDKVRDFLWQREQELVGIVYMRWAEEVLITTEMYEWMRVVEKRRREKLR